MLKFVIRYLIAVEHGNIQKFIIKKKICLFLQKEKNLSGHLFLGRSRWAKQTIYQ